MNARHVRAAQTIAMPTTMPDINARSLYGNQYTPGSTRTMLAGGSSRSPRNSELQMQNQSKFGELRNAADNLDKDLENQNTVRRQRDLKIEAQNAAIGAINSTIKNLEHQLNSHDERLKRLKESIVSEKDAREHLGKSILNLIDERVKEIYLKIEAECVERENMGSELNKKIIRVEEKLTNNIETKIEEERKIRASLEDYVAKLADRLTGIQNAMQAESVRMQELVAKNMTNVNKSLAHLQNALDTEKTMRERDVASARQEAMKEADDIRVTVAASMKDINAEIKRVVNKFSDEVTLVRGDLDKEKQAREEADAYNMSKVNDLLADLVQQVDKQNKARDDENALRFKSIDDWLCKLNFAIEVEKEQREKDVSNLADELADERKEREEDEKAVIMLLETNMAKVYKGLEKLSMSD
jgi:predicted  nucleic acid-binding Zn-ribbon protein